MRKRNYQRIIASMILAFSLTFESAFPLSVYAAEHEAEYVTEENQTKENQTEENQTKENQTEEYQTESLSDEAEVKSSEEQQVTESEAQEGNDVESRLVYEGEQYTEDQLQNMNDVDYDGYIVKLKDSTTSSEVKEIESALKELPEGEESQELQKNSMYSVDSMDAIEEAVPVENIDYIEPDVQCELLGTTSYTATPNDTYFKQTSTNWPWLKANTAGAWSLGLYGQNTSGSEKIKVAVIDSGIASNHPDLNYSNIDTGYTYCLGDERAGAEDEYGHGTFVTGVIAASMNNGIGVCGSMPGLEIYPIRIYEKNDEGNIIGGNISDVIKGISQAEAVGADVINMSFGTKSKLVSFGEACTDAINQGMILVASVGNDGSSAVNYPAGYDGVIGVGSVTQFVVRASSSNYNSSVDVTAPGHGVMGLALGDSSDADSYYEKGYGTSFSTPMVAALAGMAKSIDKNITSSEFETLLSKTCRDMGDSGKDEEYGYGVVNFGNMAELMLEEKNKSQDDSSDSSNDSSNDNSKDTSKDETDEDESDDTEPVSYGDGEDESEPAGPVDINKAKIYITTSVPYTGKKLCPGVSVVYDDQTLVKDKDYTVTCSNNLKVGSATAVVAGIGDYDGQATYLYYITPKGTSVSSCTRSKYYLTVKWKKQSTKMSTSRISGYEVQIADDSAFSENAKTYTVSGYSKTSKKITGLSRKTKYYTRVRTYMKVGYVTYYSSWSASKSYTTK